MVKRSVVYTYVLLGLITFSCAYGFPSSANASVPLAARLLSVAYNDTSQGGLSVTVTGGFNGLRGITNDGTTIYLLDGSGNITTVPMSSLTGSAGSSISVAGTTHTVGWGVSGAPSFSFPDGRGLAYSNGCIFINDDTGSGGTIHLYCIDVSDWSVTQITVPSDESLPEGHGWGYGTMIDFADGRIGKVSAYAATSTPSSGYSSYIRMYTVSGTGKSATIAWSHDYYMFDTENWNTDDHGIATDGTYLYRIEFSGNHLSDGDFKSWPLDESGAPSQEYVGSYTEPFSNMTYLSHDHTGDRYMMGNYAGDQFYITSASDPGPGPGNPLTPTFGSITSIAGGYTTQITNYDSSFTWSASTTAGSVSVSGTGLVTVSGLSDAQTATTTISTSKSGVPNGSASDTGSSADSPPSISSLAATSTTSTTTSITWTTNKAASTEVVYSVDTQYASSTGESDTGTRVTSHSDTLSNLLACTIYNYETVSADAAGSYATSTSGTFTTTGCWGGATPSAATSTPVTVAIAATSSVSDSGRIFTVATPANFTATSSSVVIQIKGLDSSTVLGSIGKPSNSLTSAASIVFDVSALINNTTVLDSFNTPVTISYTYTATDVAGLDPSSLTMYHYHDGTWLKLNNCSVNTSTDTITCEAPSFSTFAIFGTSNSSNSGNSSASSGAGLPWCSGPSAPGWNVSLAGGGCGQTASAAVASISEQTVAASSSSSSSGCPYYHFTRLLHYGDQGADVKALQRFLNCSGFPLAASGPGSPGNETTYFVDKTLKSLDAFQEAYAPSVLAPIRATKGTGIFAQHSMAQAYALMRQSN